jgi:hypothetical protein
VRFLFHSFWKHEDSGPLPNLVFLVGFDVLTAAVMKSTVFWYITPCSPMKVNERFRGTYRPYLQGRRISRAWNQTELCLSPAFTLASCSAYSSTLNIGAIDSSETSVAFQRTTRRYIPGYITLSSPCINTTRYLVRMSKRNDDCRLIILLFIGALHLLRVCSVEW